MLQFAPGFGSIYDVFYSLEQVEALDFKYDEYCWAITSKAQCGDLTHGAKKRVFGAISM
jgi:hypothetical protein